MPTCHTRWLGQNSTGGVLNAEPSEARRVSLHFARSIASILVFLKTYLAHFASLTHLTPANCDCEGIVRIELVGLHPKPDRGESKNTPVLFCIKFCIRDVFFCFGECAHRAATSLPIEVETSVYAPATRKNLPVRVKQRHPREFGNPTRRWNALFARAPLVFYSNREGKVQLVGSGRGLLQDS